MCVDESAAAGTQCHFYSVLEKLPLLVCANAVCVGVYRHASSSADFNVCSLHCIACAHEIQVTLLGHGLHILQNFFTLLDRGLPMYRVQWRQRSINTSD